jgi:hypothetical protein
LAGVFSPFTCSLQPVTVISGSKSQPLNLTRLRLIQQSLLFIPICLSGEHLRTAIQIHNTTVSKAIAQIIFPSPVPFNALAEGDIFFN